MFIQDVTKRANDFEMINRIAQYATIILVLAQTATWASHPLQAVFRTWIRGNHEEITAIENSLLFQPMDLSLFFDHEHVIWRYHGNHSQPFFPEGNESG